LGFRCSALAQAGDLVAVAGGGGTIGTVPVTDAADGTIVVSALMAPHCTGKGLIVCLFSQAPFFTSPSFSFFLSESGKTKRGTIPKLKDVVLFHWAFLGRPRRGFMYDIARIALCQWRVSGICQASSLALLDSNLRLGAHACSVVASANLAQLVDPNR
jgi:hypothetical protein